MAPERAEEWAAEPDRDREVARAAVAARAEAGVAAKEEAWGVDAAATARPTTRNHLATPTRDAKTPRTRRHENRTTDTNTKTKSHEEHCHAWWRQYWTEWTGAENRT